ncbi:MAG: hypothetical protein ABH869_03020 [Candidatus Omnitrophota bacterium]
MVQAAFIQNIAKEDMKKWFPDILGYLCDYIIIPGVMLFFVFQPNFIHGYIDHFEAGKELVCINEVFYGRLPYKEIFQLFGPLNLYFQAFFMSLFGKTLVVLRWYFYAGTMVSLIATYWIGRILCRTRFFACAIAFFLITETVHPFWMTRWGGFRFGAGLLALLCMVIFFKTKQRRAIFFAGVLAAIAFLITFDVGTIALTSIGAAFLIYTACEFLKTGKLDLRPVTIFSVSAAGVLGCFLFYFIVTGMAGAYIDTIAGLLKHHGGAWTQEGVSLRNWDIIRPDRIFRFDFKYIFPAIIYIFSVVYLIQRARKKKINLKDYSIAGLSIYGALMYKHGFRIMTGPQFQVALQPVIVLGFVFLENVFNRISELIRGLRILPRQSNLNKKNVIRLVIYVFIFIFGISYAVFSEKRFFGNLKKWVYYQKNKEQLMPVYSGVVPVSAVKWKALNIKRAKGVLVPEFQAEEMEMVTGYIKAVTVSGESVLAFPEHGIYNFLADRPCVGRFGVPTVAYTAPKWRQELVLAVKKEKPRYIIYNRELSNLAKAIKSTKELLPEVIDYIQKNYIVEKSFGNTDIMRRK